MTFIREIKKIETLGDQKGKRDEVERNENANPSFPFHFSFSFQNSRFTHRHFSPLYDKSQKRWRLERMIF